MSSSAVLPGTGRTRSRLYPLFAGVAAWIGLTLFGSCKVDEVVNPTDVLSQAIAAHGGRDALSRLDDLKIASDVVFKGQLHMRRVTHWRGVNNWSMTLETDDGRIMRLGMENGNCWKQNQYLAEMCSPADIEELRRMAALQNARLLHRIATTDLRAAEHVLVNGISCPAIRAGDVLLAFDPKSHRLVQVQLGDRSDTLSQDQNVGGAMIAAHRVLTIGGALDVEETWKEIIVGGSDAAALRAPELPRDGLVIEATEPIHPVAWMEIDDPSADPTDAIARLDAFVREQGRVPSGADGVILVAPETDGGRWRLATGVEGGSRISSLEVRGLHLEEWPPFRFVGVFRQGDVAIDEQAAVLRQLVRDRGLDIAADARWQVWRARVAFGQPAAERLALFRIAVKGAVGPDVR